MTSTFGFEAEFANNVANMAGELYRLGRTYSSDIHNYTCDCVGCEYGGDEPYDIRVKHDSSCGGEVISRILSTDEWDAAASLMADVQRCAVETDTVPGLQAGFHVHVGTANRHRATVGKLIYAFLLFEEVLSDFAGGRWPSNRGWNIALRATAAPFLLDWLVEHQGMSAYDVRSMTSSTRLARLVIAEDMEREFYRSLADTSRMWDRHATLATSGRHPTVEFRLWNSTRSAWRMELWCRLSVALTRPSFLNELLAAHAVDGASLSVLLEAINGYSDSRMAELAERQVAYQDRVRSGDLPFVEAMAS